MALYEVERTDEVQPGEFASGLVLAGGNLAARTKLTHLEGVQKDGKNLKATKVDVAKAAFIVSIYFDERES